MSEYYWSPSDAAFYPAAIYGHPTIQLSVTEGSEAEDVSEAWEEAPNPDCTLPKDAMPVETATYEQALAAREQGKRVVAGDDGHPIITDPPAETVEQLANRKRRELDAARDAAFTAGLKYEFNGETDVVQTRPQDQINLLGLSAKAQRLIAAGQPDATLTFRGGDNVNRELTAVEIDTLTLAALGHIETIYQKSWELKDGLERALLEGDQAEIEQLFW